MATLVIMAIAFFFISHFGFLREDDVLTYFETASLADVFQRTKLFYLNKGGRWFSVACQYLFAGYLGEHKLWFDVVNTLFFSLLIWVCGALICSGGRRGGLRVYLQFALLFWFLCPEPGESLFWIAGSVTYLWAVSLTLLFLVVYCRHKDESYGFWGKVVLFLFSVLAATEFVSCVSICGAFVVYYLFHFKEFRGNAAFLVIGFVVGTLLVLFAPGNFARAAWEGQSFLSKLQDLASHPIYEITKYKALWLFLITLVLGSIRNRWELLVWMRRNMVLLMSLGWSVIAFSAVFRPLNRALFFPETLSIVLLMKCIRDNRNVFEIRPVNDFLKNVPLCKYLCITLLFVVFCMDVVSGVIEAKRQQSNHSAMMERIVAEGGVGAMDRLVPHHRMAYVERFPEWDWAPMANRLGLDSIQIYPYFCQDQFFNRDDPALQNTYVEEHYVDDNSMGRLVRLIVRVKEDDLLEAEGHVAITVDYSRPRKWYKTWLDKRRNYQYDRTLTKLFEEPETCYGGYGYYIIWMKRENAVNLKRVKVDLQ